MRKNSAYTLYIRERKDGSRIYYYDIPTSISGTVRLRGSCHTDNEAEAHAVALNIITQIKNERIHGVKPSIGLGEAVKKYWKQHGQYLKSSHAVHLHCRKLLEFFDNIAFDKIGTREIRDYQTWRKAQYLHSTTQRVTDPEKLKNRPAPRLVSNAWVNRELSTFRKMYHMAQKEWGIGVGSIDFKTIWLPEKDSNVIFFNEVQIEAIIGAAADYLQNIVRFIFMTGVRRSNATKLNIKDLDFENRVIKFHVKSNKPEGKIIYFPMYEELYNFLVEIEPSKKGFMFTKNGKPVHCPTKAFVSACAAVGITLPRGQKLHVLRHSTVTYLLNKGVPPHVVQQIVGHSSITTTMGYTHVLDKNKREALQDAFTTQIRHTK